MGCFLLAFAADRFVTAASTLSTNLGVPPLIIGVVLIGFSTSLPEMIVSGVAAWKGYPLIGIGNAIGSNIANIGLVIAIIALMSPLNIPIQILRREFVLLFIAMIIAWLLISDGDLTRAEAICLLIFMLFILFFMLLLAKKPESSTVKSNSQINHVRTYPKKSTFYAIIGLFFGLLLLVFSSRILIYGATHIAYALGMSKLVIGLTVVAFGTSLPELAASIASVIHHKNDLALGNIIGSNIFNVLGVLAVPGIIHPMPVPSLLLWRDFPIMFCFTAILIALTYGLVARKKHQPAYQLGRPGAIVLLACYCAYQLYLCLSF